MKRVPCTTVTDALMRAMEEAESLEDIIVIAYVKGGGGLWYGNDDSTLANTNLLIDQFKLALLRMSSSEGDHD